MRLSSACVLLLTSLMLINGCSSLEILTQLSKDRRIVDPKGAVAENGNRYKIGLPYVIKGNTYYPKVDYDYDEIGIASWYGEAFHGKPTANGAIFNMHAVSAAHRTLPLPSWVEVENLNNGRRLVVKVNDRGPFHGNRIIDLSMRAAELLDFKKKGVTKIRVRILSEDSRKLAAWMKGKKTSPEPKLARNGDVTLTRVSDGVKSPKLSVLEAPLKNVEGSRTIDNTVIPPKGGLYVQVAAFTQYKSALLIRKKIRGYRSTVGLSRDPDGGGDQLYKVLVGPFVDASAATRARKHLQQQNFPGAHLITWRS